MDADRFDSLTRSLMSSGSRRRALGAIAGGAIGLLGLADTDHASAAKSGKCKPRCGECARCKRGDCKKTKHGKKRCSRGKCQPLREGTPCTTGTCQGGSCIAALPISPPPPPAPLPPPSQLCPEGFTVCGGSCVDTSASATHCGTCNNPCRPNQTCCSGICRNLNTHNANCGACGNVCPAGTNCCNGTCACIAPQICCRGSCQAAPCV